MTEMKWPHRLRHTGRNCYQLIEEYHRGNDTQVFIGEFTKPDLRKLGLTNHEIVQGCKRFPSTNVYISSTKLEELILEKKLKQLIGKK
jgi:hypothetical protein